MSTSLDQKCRDLVVELGLGTADCVRTVTPLTGGVASDIAVVDLSQKRICAKFALEKLKVAEEWRVPVHRNRAEYAWLEVANSLTAGSGVRLFGQSDALCGFAMEFIEGADVYLWKEHLLAGRGVSGEAERVGDLLGLIHSVTAKPAFDRTPFDNRDDFLAIRIEPYLTFTASRRPEVAAAISAVAEDLYRRDAVLIHGDTSPKNIMFRKAEPIILDAECATMGDPCFDPSFCLNHLILKALHLPGSRAALLVAAGEFWNAYRAHVDWEDTAGLEARVCALLPILMLARVDGKSPVEYLDDTEREFVRRLAIPLIQSPSTTLNAFVQVIAQKLKEHQT